MYSVARIKYSLLLYCIVTFESLLSFTSSSCGIYKAIFSPIIFISAASCILNAELCHKIFFLSFKITIGICNRSNHCVFGIFKILFFCCHTIYNSFCCLIILNNTKNNKSNVIPHCIFWAITLLVNFSKYHKNEKLTNNKKNPVLI